AFKDKHQECTETGIPKLHRGSLKNTQPVAYLFMNDYEGSSWPGNAGTMELIGRAVDLNNMLNLLDAGNFEIHVKENLEEDQMIFELEELPFKDMGREQDPVDLPRDYRVINDDLLEGITSQMMYDTLLTSDIYRRLLLVSDFCHVGNYYQLRYHLCLEGRPEWKQSTDWNNKTPASRVIHFAGAHRDELAGEGNNSGGFFTNVWVYKNLGGIPHTTGQASEDSCCGLGLDSVSGGLWLLIAGYDTNAICRSFKADLTDPDVLKKFQVGDLVEVE
ncbi:hypothetical protein FRC07_005842, partial [Ceratobasidium sp. 392]